MYHHLALVSVILLCLPFHTLTTIALAIAPQGTIVTAFNKTQGTPTLNLTLSENFLDPTLTASQNFISYRVPHSPTTLLFHSFGTRIPVDELLQTIAIAVRITYKYIGEGRGRTPVAHGFFAYTNKFLNLDQLDITVGDFRESGRPMTYYALFDVLRGVGEFMLLPEQETQELEFEVEVQGIGYVGTGHVDYKPFETPTSNIT